MKGTYIKKTYTTIKEFADSHNIPVESVTHNGGVQFLKENPLVLESVILCHLLNPYSRKVVGDIKEEKSKILAKLRWTKYNKQRPLKKRECVYCGSLFTTERPRVNTCSEDCKVNHTKLRKKINTQNKRERDAKH